MDDLKDEFLETTQAPLDEESPESQEAKAAQEVQNLKEQVLRCMADFENYRKRAEREREDISKFAITAFARDLLPVVDNLRRALESATAQAQDSAQLLNSLVEGVTFTEAELLGALSKHGVEKIDPLGQPFDHNLHQAMFEQEEGDHTPGTVIQVLQTGYQLQGRLLRPALVGVAKAKSL